MDERKVRASVVCQEPDEIATSVEPVFRDLQSFIAGGRRENRSWPPLAAYSPADGVVRRQGLPAWRGA
jgi:hypothetical protein